MMYKFFDIEGNHIWQEWVKRTHGICAQRSPEDLSSDQDAIANANDPEAQKIAKATHERRMDERYANG